MILCSPSSGNNTKDSLPRQCCQNILYLKFYTLFWQSLRIILYL